ncbi:MAG: RDD family protein [Candidatus Rokubacteria bacterium]|nr:RDD family protein [Candidatus Rokubacteria bacterium]
MWRGAESSGTVKYPKVILPRRFKADSIDGVAATILMLVPLFALTAIGDLLPSWLQPLPLIGIPGGVFYIVFRDAMGKGASVGKRALGLRIIDLRTGTPCSARRVWARNLLDLIPIVDLIDFVLMCLDSRGQKMMDKVLDTQVVETW